MSYMHRVKTHVAHVGQDVPRACGARGSNVLPHTHVVIMYNEMKNHSKLVKNLIVILFVIPKSLHAVRISDARDVNIANQFNGIF